MAYGGGTIIDPDMGGNKGVDGPDPGANPPVTAGTTPGALQLTQLLPANPAKGWSTAYYPVYTDQGDIGAVIPGTLTDQRVRLVDPSTGETLAEGVGNDGAQQIATLANSVGKQLKGSAAYNIQVEMQPGQFTTVGGDDINHPHANLLKTIVQVAGPLLGSMIPGLGPVLGAALGGFGSTLATGGDFKSALLSALTSGAGNSLGGAFSDVLRGAPISFAGTNALGGLLNGLTSGSGGAVGDAIANSGGALSGLTGAAGNTISPLIVNGALGGGLTSALTGALGTGLGSLVPNLFAGQDAGNADELTVTGSAPSSGVAIPGVTATATGSPGAGVTAPATGDTTGQSNDGFFGRNNLLDLLGQTGGNVGADLGVFGLSQLLGLTPSAGSDGSTLPAPGFDNAPDTGGLPGNPAVPTGATDGGGLTTPGSGVPGATFGTPTAVATPGGALGQALGVANIGGGGGAVAPLAASPTLNVRGSTAPDIYPWRGRQPLGQAA